MGGKDWVAWHREYETDPGRARRLEVVRNLLSAALDGCPAGPIRLVAACAGDGRDVRGVLASHPRARDVRARLLEIEPALVAQGKAEAARQRLPQVEFLEADASEASSYVGIVPAEVVMFCGVFGNLSDLDVRKVVRTLPELCSSSAFVLWTRSRAEPDLTVRIRSWFEETGFHEVDFVPVPDSLASAGLHRLVSAPRPLSWEGRLFSFVPDRRTGPKGSFPP